MKQATLVSLYDKKPDDLLTLIQESQTIISEMLGVHFAAYNIEQIHATIVGLERREDKPSQYYNRNFWRLRQHNAVMDLKGFLNFLRLYNHFPLKIQIAGFQNRQYSFTSRCETPYKRSFTIQGENVVIMGWPIHIKSQRIAFSFTNELFSETQLYPKTLDNLRRTAQDFNILHAYHREPTAVDNDFYFRIGMLRDPAALRIDVVNDVSHRVREYLSRRSPVVVEIRHSDLYVVTYRDERLPKGTPCYALDDVQVTEEFLCHCYQ
jgi:hypothetical protein